MSAKKAAKTSAFNKPLKVSPALAKIIGEGPMPRTEVTKKVWDYIKKLGLQDKKDKRKINPNPDLAKVLGTTSAVDMFKMTSLVNKHLE